MIAGTTWNNGIADIKIGELSTHTKTPTHLLVSYCHCSVFGVFSVTMIERVIGEFYCVGSYKGKETL